MKLGEAPTFWELCDEFDKDNIKDPVYNLVMRYVLRFIGSWLETKFYFFLSQLCKKEAGSYRITDSQCLDFIRQNSGTMKDIDAKIALFEWKLSVFLD